MKRVVVCVEPQINNKRTRTKGEIVFVIAFYSFCVFITTQKIVIVIWMLFTRKTFF